MPVLVKRSKMVSVRLSHDEFEELKEVCEALGARSISDLARTAMHRLMNSGHTAEVSGLEAQVNMLGEKVARLQRELAELRGLVRGGAASCD
jgi:hypothetical protein